jgi:(S)-mandelate dehydrogenase
LRTASDAISIEDLRRAARARLPRSVFEFFDAGAEDEVTLRANREAFERVRLLPRVLVDVAKVDMAASLLGREAKLPIAVAPTGAVGFGWPGGDVAIAKSAAACGIPYTLSTTATASIERVAREAPGRLWFQAYIFKGRHFAFRLMERARACGYEALMITVDLPVGGKRERDNRNHFSIPFRFTARNLRDFASKPGWAAAMLRGGMPVMENLIGFTAEAVTAAGIASSVGRNYDPSFDWEGLKAIRDAWPHRLIVKGIVHPADAERAAALGCDAVVVSNHGGRQLDSAPAAICVLPQVVAAIGERCEVWFDSGVRSGQDVLKALALGARATLIGKAFLYGLGAMGERGVATALELIRRELDVSMALTGMRDVREVGPQVLWQP